MTSFTPRTFTIPAYPISKKVTVGTSGEYVTLGIDQCAVVLEPSEVGPIMLALIAAGSSITDQLSEDEPHVHIGQQLAFLREQAGLSIAETATRGDFDAKWLVDVENGEIEPRNIAIAQLTRLYAAEIAQTAVAARELKRSTAPGSPEFEQVI